MKVVSSPIMTNHHCRNVLRYALAVGATLGALSNCAKEARETSIGGETHFLTACDSNETCGSTLACLCGVCTRTCTDNSVCRSFAASTECVQAVDRPAASACSDAPASSFCDVPCTTDESCRTFPNLPHCDRGFCRRTVQGIDDAGTPSQEAGAASCVRGQVSANEVLFIGDSFFATSHQITVGVEDLARQVSAIAVNERYRDNSSLVGNYLALASPNIADQYAKGQTDSPAKVVVMTGGGADILHGTCGNPPTKDCPILVNATAAAEQLLSKMAQDRVQHVV